MSFKKLKQIMYVFVAYLIFSVCFSGSTMTADAADVGWYKDSHGWYYYYTQTDYYTDGLYEIGGNYYFFDEEGYMCTGWIVQDGYTYYANLNGVIQRGWRQIGGDYYYFDYYMQVDKWIDDTYYVGEDGKLASNKIAYKDGSYYYVGSDGKIDCTVGWKRTTPYYEGDYIDVTYVVDSTGALADGWMKISGKWYYFQYGEMMADTVCEIDGDGYYFAPSGVMVTGWYDHNSYEMYPVWSYSDANGRLYDGWLQSCGEWYYLDEGFAVEGRRYIDGQDYFFKPSGELVKGWYSYKYTDYYGEVHEQWIYTSPVTGAEYTGWVQNNGKWYYIYNGYMEYSDYCTINDDKYYFDENGEMLKGWFSYEDLYGYTDIYHDLIWYYTDPNTGIAYDGWLQYGGEWYYIEDGAMRYDGTYTIDEKEYKFDKTGKLIRGWYKDEYTYSDGDIDIEWYYSDAVTGEVAIGWKEIAGKWYYFDSYGEMYEGDDYWRTIDGKSVYLAPSGELVLGWYEHKYINYDGTVYKEWWYTNPVTGERYTGWVKSGNDWYYVSNSTNMYKASEYDSDGYNTYTIDDVKYYFDTSGKLIRGWYSYEYKFQYGYDLFRNETKWIYTNPVDGSPYTGWVQSGDNWYYIEDNYMLYNTWDSIDGENYYFDSTGKLIRGWGTYSYQIGANEFYAQEIYTNPVSGAEYTGWAKKGNDWYYVSYSKPIKNTTYWVYDSENNPSPYRPDYMNNADYSEAYRKWQLSNKYIFTVGGALSKGGWTLLTSDTEDAYFYANSDGTVYDGWVKSGGKYYYIYEGMMMRNCRTPDGYYVDKNGVWIQ